jgi:hypothetical protein
MTTFIIEAPSSNNFGRTVYDLHSNHFCKNNRQGPYFLSGRNTERIYGHTCTPSIVHRRLFGENSSVSKGSKVIGEGFLQFEKQSFALISREEAS